MLGQKVLMNPCHPKIFRPFLFQNQCLGLTSLSDCQGHIKWDERFGQALLDYGRMIFNFERQFLLLSRLPQK